MYDGHRYAVQGAGQPSGRARLLLYGCDNLRRWSELGCLLGADDPVAAKLAPADLWECPNLVRIDEQWVIVLSLWRLAEGLNQLVGVRYLLGALTAQGGHGLRFRATSGGVVDYGPAFYAPQLPAEPDRTLLWGWAWELGRSDEQIAEAGWAGVLTFPRELYVRNGVLGARPATELEGLRLGNLSCRPGVPFQEQAFELIASGPVSLGLDHAGAVEPVSAVEATPTDPARILVDGSMVETFIVEPAAPRALSDCREQVGRGRRCRHCLPAGRPSSLATARARSPQSGSFVTSGEARLGCRCTIPAAPHLLLHSPEAAPTLAAGMRPTR